MRNRLMALLDARRVATFIYRHCFMDTNFQNRKPKNNPVKF